MAGTPAAKYLNVFADHINFSVFCEEFHEEFYHLEQFCNLKTRVLMGCAYGLIFFIVKYDSIIIPKTGVSFNCKHSFPYIWEYYFQMFTFFVLCIKIGFLKTRMSSCTLKVIREREVKGFSFLTGNFDISFFLLFNFAGT